MNTLRILILFTALSASAQEASSPVPSQGGVSDSLQTQISSYKTLLSLEKKLAGTPKQRDFLVRLVEAAGKIQSTAKKEGAKASEVSKLLGSEPKQELIRVSTQFIEKYPKDPMLPQFYWLRGRAHGELGRPDLSGADFKKAYEKGIVGSEFWTKAGVAYGDYLKANQRQNDALVQLKTVLRSSKPAFRPFILESLAQLQTQLRLYPEALSTLNELLQMESKQLTFSRESVVTSKGFVLAKLKTQAFAMFDEAKGLSQQEKLLIYRNWMLETMADGREAEVVLFVKDPALLQEPDAIGFILSMEALKVIHERQNRDQFRAFVDALKATGAPPQNPDMQKGWSKGVDQLKWTTSEYQKQVAKTASKNPLEAKTLNKLYSLISTTETDPAALQEVKYNQASLALIGQEFEKAESIYQSLGNYRDSKQKSDFAFLGGLQKKHQLKDEWSFVPIAELNEVEKARFEQLESQSCKPSQDQKPNWEQCHSMMKYKSQMKGSGVSSQEPFMREVAFKEEVPLPIRESVFSALFDAQMKAGNISAAMELSNQAEASGLDFQSDLKATAAKTAKNSAIQDLFKLYEQGKDDLVLQKVDEMKEKKLTATLPEALIIGGLSAQRRGDMKKAEGYYVEFEGLLAASGSQGLKWSEPKFEDLYHTGRAVWFDEKQMFEDSAKHWAKIKVWAGPGQKEAALKSAWYSGQYPIMSSLIRSNFFCKEPEAARICSFAWNRFLLTWPVLQDKLGSKPAWIPAQPQDQLSGFAIQSRFKPEAVRLDLLAQRSKEVQSRPLIEWVAYFPAWFKASDDILRKHVEQTRVSLTSRAPQVESLQKDLVQFTQNLKQIENLQVASWPQLKVSAMLAVALLCSLKEKEIEAVLQTDFFKQPGSEDAKKAIETLASQFKEKRVKNIMEAIAASKSAAWVPDTWKTAEADLTRGLSESEKTSFQGIWANTQNWDSKCVIQDPKVVSMISQIEVASQKALWPRVGYWADRLSSLNLGTTCEFKEMLLSRMLRPSANSKALAGRKATESRIPASTQGESSK